MFRWACVFLVFPSTRGLTVEKRQPDASASWQKHYAKLHRKVLPSPKQLSEEFDAKRKAAEKSKATAKALKVSKVEMIREGNKAAQALRLRASRSVAESRAKAQLPDEAPEARCGSQVPVAQLGFKNNDLVRRVFGGSFLQHRASAGPSTAVPKAGATQILKDEDRDEMGTVMSAGEGEDEVSTPIIPYVKVFKDGFSFTACVKDAMYEFGDKYGSNADKYSQKGVGETYNVSIVKYDDIVLREKQKLMSPKVCYDFCRTVPDMVFFGITAGKECYCTPFFDKMEGSGEHCDLPCPGDSSRMCGGQKEKSQMFEMHMCADTAGDLLYASVNAEVALVYFYDTAFMTDKLAHQIQKTGEVLQQIAGEGGDPGSADTAQAAKEEAGSLFDPKTGWGKCKDEYERLLKIYVDAEKLHKADFSFAKETEEAEFVIQTENMLQTKLTECAQEAEHPILAVYPFYYDFMAALDEKDLQARSDKYGKAVVSFHPIIWHMGRTHKRALSSCTGEPIGPPMPLPFAGCAEACRQTNRRPRCNAFQYYQIMDGDKQMPLCILYERPKSVNAFTCDVLDGPSLVQKNVSAISLDVGGHGSGPSVSSADTVALCSEIQRIRHYSGLSCQAIFGKDSELIGRCPKECEGSEGLQYTAICMSNVLAGRPRLKYKPHARCFGEGNGKTDQGKADFRIQEFGKDASGGAGPLIEGEIEMGGAVVAEPYGKVWTPGPAGQR